MITPLLLAKTAAGAELVVLPGMSNRHGIIAGATGTGKTITLQRRAEQFSERGVPVFMADVKGDLAGLARAGESHPKIIERIRLLKIKEHTPTAFPVVFWDVFGELGQDRKSVV